MERFQLGLDLTALRSGAGYVRIWVSRVVILYVSMRGMGGGDYLFLYLVVHGLPMVGVVFPYCSFLLVSVLVESI